MKNKGFTLIELLAVIAIMAIIAVLATPNIVNMVDSGKKNSFIADAQNMISMAIYKNKLTKYDDLFTIDGNCRVITAANIGFTETKDPDGNNYDLNNSKVKICKETSSGITTLKYYVKTISTGNNSRGIYGNTTNDYILQENLTKNSVKDIATDN